MLHEFLELPCPFLVSSHVSHIVRLWSLQVLRVDYLQAEFVADLDLLLLVGCLPREVIGQLQVLRQDRLTRGISKQALPILHWVVLIEADFNIHEPSAVANV